MKLLCLALVATIFFGCSASKKSAGNMHDNLLTEQEKNNGWQLLFDGATPNGWHTYGYRSVDNAWAAENGTMHVDTTTRKSWKNETHDILTDDEYDNFDFVTDWKIAKNGNSGILIYVHEDKSKYSETYNTGPEMQVLDNDGHPDGKIIKHHAGDLYDLISSSSEPVKPVGEWNHAEIISNKGRLDFYLNGQHIISTTMWDDNWNTLVAGSKFKSMPGFAKFTKGHIALQDHGDEVWYKNIKIRKL